MTPHIQVKGILNWHSQKIRQKKSFELISNLNPVISNSSHAEGEDGSHYNKDADMFVCPEEHMAILKARTDRKNTNRNQVNTYYISIENAKIARSVAPATSQEPNKLV